MCAPSHVAEQETTQEGGDIAAAVQPVSSGKTGEGQANDGNLGPNIGKPSPLLGNTQYFHGEVGEDDTNSSADTDLLGDQRQRQGRAAFSVGFPRGQGQEYQEHRYTQPVIEPALNIQSLAQPAGYGLIGNNTFSECGIGGSEHGGQETHFIETEIGKKSPYPHQYPAL